MPYLVVSDALPDALDRPAAPESPDVMSDDFFDFASLSFFLLFFAFLLSSVSSVAEAPLVPELVSALLAGPPAPVIPVFPVASCDGITVGDDVSLEPEAPDDDMPEAPLLPALLAGPPAPVIPVLPVAFCDGITVGDADVLPDAVSLAPEVPDDDVPEAPLLPELVSALLAGPPAPVIPVFPVAFCDGITVGEADVLPVAGSVAVVCASTTDDADATITNDNERSVFFNAMGSSLH